MAFTQVPVDSEEAVNIDALGTVLVKSCGLDLGLL